MQWMLDGPIRSSSRRHLVTLPPSPGSYAAYGGRPGRRNVPGACAALRWKVYLWHGRHGTWTRSQVHLAISVVLSGRVSVITPPAPSGPPRSTTYERAGNRHPQKKATAHISSPATGVAGREPASLTKLAPMQSQGQHPNSLITLAAPTTSRPQRRAGFEPLPQSSDMGVGPPSVTQNVTRQRVASAHDTLSV
jgi:hypothetical protein